MKENVKSSPDFTKQSQKEKNIANVLLCLILDKMEQLIQQNQLAIFLFAKVLKSVLNKPIRIHLEELPMGREELDQNMSLFILDNPVVNTSLTILDLILAYSRVISPDNDIKLDFIFYKCIKADKSFRIFFTEKFYQRIFLILKLVETEVIDPLSGIQETKQYWKFPVFAVIAIEQICIKEVFENNLETLKENYFKSFYLLDKFLQLEAKFIDSSSIYMFFSITLQPLKEITLLKIGIKQYGSLILECLSRISKKVFINTQMVFEIREKGKNQQQKNSLLSTDVLIGDGLQFPLISYVIERVEEIKKKEVYVYFEQQITLCNFCIFHTLLEIGNQELTDSLFAVMMKIFQDNIEFTFNAIQEKQQNQQILLSLCTSAVSYFPLLVALQTKSCLTQQVVQGFFERNFPTTKGELISKFIVVLQAFLPSDRRTAMWISQMIVKNDLQPNNEYYQQLFDSLENIQAGICSPISKIYDLHILSIQLLVLVMDKSQRRKFFSSGEIIFPQAKYSKNEYYSDHYTERSIKRNLQQDEEGYDVFMTELQYKQEQILFDSTPMVNIFSLCAEKYFPGQDIYQQICEEIIKETLITIFTSKQTEEVEQQMIEQTSESIFHSNCKLPIIQVFNFPETAPADPQQTAHTNNNPEQLLTLKTQFRNKIYPRHFGRYQVRDIVAELDANQENVSTEFLKEDLINFFGSDFFLRNIFPHQAQMLIVVLMEEEFQQKLLKNISLETNKPHFTCFCAIPVYCTLLLLLVFMKDKKDQESINEIQISENQNQNKKLLENQSDEQCSELVIVKEDQNYAKKEEENTTQLESAGQQDLEDVLNQRDFPQALNKDKIDTTTIVQDSLQNKESNLVEKILDSHTLMAMNTSDVYQLESTGFDTQIKNLSKELLLQIEKVMKLYKKEDTCKIIEKRIHYELDLDLKDYTNRFDKSMLSKILLQLKALQLL